MKRVSLIMFSLLFLGSISFSQTLTVYNYTSCQLEVRAYADTICSWNCPSNTSIVNSGGGTANLTPNCTWTSQHKWNSIKFWKYGYTPPMTGGTCQRISGCGPSSVDWNCGGGGGTIYAVWTTSPWTVSLYD